MPPVWEEGCKTLPGMDAASIYPEPRVWVLVTGVRKRDLADFFICPRFVHKDTPFPPVCRNSASMPFCMENTSVRFRFLHGILSIFVYVVLTQILKG